MPKPPFPAPSPPRKSLAARGEFDRGDSWLGGGPEAGLARLARREAEFRYDPGDLPAPDVDLARLADLPLIAPAGPREAVEFCDFAGRARNLAREMATDPDTTELEFLHAKLCMALRRADPPPEALGLFRRIWAEHGTALARSLPTRWRVAALRSFADHGATEPERRLGGELALFFDLLKLSESERRFAGHAAWQPFAGPAHPGPLAMGLDPFDLAEGDLWLNLIGRLWRLALAGGAASELGCVLLEQIDRSDRSPLARLAKMRRARGITQHQPVD